MEEDKKIYRIYKKEEKTKMRVMMIYEYTREDKELEKLMAEKGLGIEWIKEVIKKRNEKRKKIKERITKSVFLCILQCIINTTKA